MTERGGVANFVIVYMNGLSRASHTLWKILRDMIYNHLIYMNKIADVQMNCKGIMRRIGGALGGFCVLALLSGQATSPGIVVRVIAEVETRVGAEGRELTKLRPANRVVPGDEVIYTLEIRNVGARDLVAPTVVNAIPEHMAYLADSATGPGAEISYSIDGGHRFDSPERLTLESVNGGSRIAKPIEYTHIRWKIKNTLKSKSVAFARFRAVVK